MPIVPPRAIARTAPRTAIAAASAIVDSVAGGISRTNRRCSAGVAIATSIALPRGTNHTTTRAPCCAAMRSAEASWASSVGSGVDASTVERDIEIGELAAQALEDHRVVRPCAHRDAEPIRPRHHRQQQDHQQTAFARTPARAYQFIPSAMKRARKPCVPAPPSELHVGEAEPGGQSTSRSYDQ